MSVPEHIECCVSNKLGQTSLRRCPQYFGCISLLTGTEICCSKQWKDKSSLSSSQMWQLRSEKNACASIPITFVVLMATGTKVGCGNHLSLMLGQLHIYIYIYNYRTACSRFFNKVLIKCSRSIIFVNVIIANFYVRT